MRKRLTSKSFIIALALAMCAIAYAQTQHTVVVTWTPGSCGTTVGCTTATGFNVYRATSAAGPFTILNSTPLAASATSYTDTTVINGQTVFYEVQAVDATGSLSGPSNVSNAAVIPGNPPAPTGCNAHVN